MLLQSYPRSGNTLVRHVIEDVFGVRTLTVYPHEGKASVLWSNRHTADNQSTGAPVRFVKTHEADTYKGKPHKTIYIVRDGRDTLVSYAHFLSDFMSSVRGNWKENLKKLIHGHILHWGGHVAQLQRKADAVIRFEELLTDPVAYVSEALWRVGVLDIMPKPKPENLPDFETLHDKAPSFYRKGVSDQWCDIFTPDMEAKFWQVHGKGMEIAGYERKRLASCRSN